MHKRPSVFGHASRAGARTAAVRALRIASGRPFHVVVVLLILIIVAIGHLRTLNRPSGSGAHAGSGTGSTLPNTALRQTRVTRPKSATDTGERAFHQSPEEPANDLEQGSAGSDAQKTGAGGGGAAEIVVSEFVADPDAAGASQADGGAPSAGQDGVGEHQPEQTQVGSRACPIMSPAACVCPPAKAEPAGSPRKLPAGALAPGAPAQWDTSQDPGQGDAVMSDVGDLALQPAGEPEAGESALQPPANQAPRPALSGLGFDHLKGLLNQVRKGYNSGPCLPLGGPEKPSCPKFRAAGLINHDVAGGWPVALSMLQAGGSLLTAEMPPLLVPDLCAAAPPLYDFRWHFGFELDMLRNARFSSVWLMNPIPDTLVDFTQWARSTPEIQHAALASGAGASSRALQWLYESLYGNSPDATVAACNVPHEQLSTTRVFTNTAVGAKRWLIALPAPPAHRTKSAAQLRGEHMAVNGPTPPGNVSQNSFVPLLQTSIAPRVAGGSDVFIPPPHRIDAAVRTNMRPWTCGTSRDGAGAGLQTCSCFMEHTPAEEDQRVQKRPHLLLALTKPYAEIIQQLNIGSNSVTILRLSVAGFEYSLLPALAAEFTEKVAERKQSTGSVVLSPEEEEAFLPLRTCQLLLQSNPWLLEPTERQHAETALSNSLLALGFELITSRRSCIGALGNPVACGADNGGAAQAESFRAPGDLLMTVASSEFDRMLAGRANATHPAEHEQDRRDPDGTPNDMAFSERREIVRYLWIHRQYCL